MVIYCIALLFVNKNKNMVVFLDSSRTYFHHKISLECHAYHWCRPMVLCCTQGFHCCSSEYWHVSPPDQSGQGDDGQIPINFRCFSHNSASFPIFNITYVCTAVNPFGQLPLTWFWRPKLHGSKSAPLVQSWIGLDSAYYLHYVQYIFLIEVPQCIFSNEPKVE